MAQQQQKSTQQQLCDAAEEGKLNDVKRLLGLHGTSINGKANGATPLHRAASGGHIEIVSLLLDRGAEIASRDENNGGTPIHCASSRGHTEIVNLFLSRGVDLNIRDTRGATPLHRASCAGRIGVVSLLLDRGAEIDIQDQDGVSPLHLASSYEASFFGGLFGTKRSCYPDVASLLLDRGANINIADKDGITPLNRATAGGHLEIVSLLIGRGADVNIPDNNGATPLHAATTSEKESFFSGFFGKKEKLPQLDLASLLLERGAEINIQDKDGATPLHRVVISRGDIGLLEVLLDRGADPFIKDKNGRTPRDYISGSGEYRDFYSRLRRRESDIQSDREQREREEVERKKLESEQRERERIQKEKERKERERQENQRNRELVKLQEEELVALRCQLSEATDSLEATEVKLLRLENERIQATNDNQKKVTALQQREQEVSQLKLEKNTLEKRWSEEIAQRDELTARLEDALHEKVHELLERQQLVENARKEIGQLQSEMERLMTENVSFKNEIISLYERIKQMETEAVGTSAGIDLNYLQRFDSLRQSVVRRFKHERICELNRVQDQEHAEQIAKLTEEIKKAERLKEKKTLHHLKDRLAALVPPVGIETSVEAGSSMESIQSQAQGLHTELESNEEELMNCGELEASMICEVERLHLLNLLKVFEVEVKLGNDNSKEQKNENEELISSLQEKITHLQLDLDAKEESLKKSLDLVNKFQRKQGIGLVIPHVRFIDLETSELNLKEKRILSGGIYHNEAKMDFPCAFKMATDDTQLMKLKREREILELIRTRDLHQESHKYLVNWLYPSQLMSEENVYFLNQSGDQLSDTASVSGLVLESGGKNLREFLRKETLISVPMSQRIHILEEVVDAVRFLHRLGIVHFDLKPENIVHFSSRDEGRWKLIDFDSSYNERSSPSDSLPRTATGTDLWLSEEFMCPEIAAVVGYLNRHQGNTTPANVAINSSNTFQSDVAINWKMDIWSLGMVAYFLFTNHSLWSDYSAAPFNHSMVSSISQEELQLILSRSLGHKEKSFVESCLKIDPFARLNATELLGKSLFSTGNSTVHANTLKVTNESMMSRFDEIQRMIKAYSDRCSPELITEELTDKFSDLYECLSSQLDRIESMTREEINALLGMRSST